ncbi:MAG: GAF domain-containing protein [Oscillatoriaceae bacterium SKYG93]|nr:GAF domain-containing protein [Oscillatoriaceae bacterium SKYG93]MDW8453480.1 GAF domain-containing protein [Oscillatoriaceae cyanobacterium SKYGB_i_bin93]
MGLPEKSYEKRIIALGRTLQILREQENVEILIETTLSYLETQFEYKLLWIGFYDRLDHRLLGKGGRTPEGDIPLLKQRFILMPGDILEQVVIQQRAVVLSDLREELRAGEWRKVAQQFNIQGTLIFPIRYKNRCFGVALLGTQLWGVSLKAEEKAQLSMVLGGLGAALYQIEIDWQRQQTKHPNQPLLRLLGKLRASTTLEQCLEAVVEETHKFVEPHRTNIYWYNPERRYFWLRASSCKRITGFRESERPVSGIMVSEVTSFYQALVADNLVTIGESFSSLNAEVTNLLMQLIRVRSLLAAPILVEKKLLGFLAVENNDARIWQEQEKNYIRGVAQLVALVAPVMNLEDTISQIKSDQILTADLTHAICNEPDWKAILKLCGERLLEHLGGSRFLVLLYKRDCSKFDVVYQTAHTRVKKPISIPTPLPALNEIDLQMLQGSQEAIEIENWGEELKLLDWRPIFLEVGVRALVVCSLMSGHSLEGLIIFTNDSARTWSLRECELIYTVSQQIGLLFHQWRLQSTIEEQQRFFDTLQFNFNALAQSNVNLQKYERLILQQLAKFYDCSLAAAIFWLPGRNFGHFVTFVTNEQDTLFNIPVQSDSLLQSILATERPLQVKVSDLSPEIMRCLKSPNVDQILAIALRTAPHHQPTGVLFLAPQSGCRFSQETIEGINLTVCQIAWCRRYLLLQQIFESQRQELECLNWYKHRRFEDFYRIVEAAVNRLQVLSNEINESTERFRGTLGSLQAMQLQQISRHLISSVQSMRELLTSEQWQLHLQTEIVPVAGLLRRGLERVASIIYKRQIWSQVHGEDKLSIRADMLKIEWIVYEILVAACRRTPKGGRLDIWCRTLNSAKVELSVIDSGSLPSTLMADLQVGYSADLINLSSLDYPSARHLLICRYLVEQMAGELHFYYNEEGRTVSKLVLPSVI